MDAKYDKIIIGCDDMASSVIHMAVANEINKIIKRDNAKLLIGSIAPDISKNIGESKTKSHFLDNEYDSIPNIDRFLNKYKNSLSDDFVLGYFIHLYTDYLWFKYFIPEISSRDYITKLDGTVVKCTGNMMSKYIYNDYTNINIQLIEQYDMDLKIFYNEPPKLDNIIQEIPMEKIKVIIDQASIIIENSKEKKEYIFNIDNIKVFVKTSVNLILSKLYELGLINN